MTIQKAIEYFKDHQRTSLKKRTQEGYKKLLSRVKGSGLNIDFGNTLVSGKRVYVNNQV